MKFLKDYFRKLKEVLTEQYSSYFILLILSNVFLFRMAIAAFVALSAIVVDWVTFCFIALFLLSFILQSLLLQKKCYPLFLFRVLIVILLGFQVGYRMYGNTRPSSSIRSIGSSYLESDDFLGFRVKPNLHDNWNWAILKNDTLIKVCYSTDSLSRRIPDDAFEYSMTHTHSGKHALFFGCSFTFGEGLMYSSTFPYLFESLNPDYKSYNYGVSGFGPHQIALLLDNQINTINEETIPEVKGFALYTYIDNHLNRVYGSSECLGWSACRSNVYIENDSLVIKEWPQAQLILAKLLNYINLFNVFDIKNNYPQDASFYNRFASIINYMAKKYWELKPGNHFYVGIYPGYDKDLNWTPYLDEKIVVLRVAPPSDYDNKDKYKISPYDYHPSGMSNEYYAAELTRLINKYE